MATEQLFLLLYRRGSVIASLVVTLDHQFKKSSVLIKELNKANLLGGHRFDKSYSNVEGIISHK